MARAGRDLVMQSYSIEAATEILRSELASVLGATARGSQPPTVSSATPAERAAACANDQVGLPIHQ
jgi:hypothetical protein